MARAAVRFVRGGSIGGRRGGDASGGIALSCAHSGKVASLIGGVFSLCVALGR
jgi:hypothetical protein